MKCQIILVLALLVVADAHRHWGRPKPRPWGGKSTSVCAGTNPCGSIYRYKEIIKMAGEDCPDSPRRFGREDSDSGSDPETESEEYDQNSSGESSEKRSKESSEDNFEENRHRRHWHGYGGGYGSYGGGYGGYGGYGGRGINRYCVSLPSQISLKFYCMFSDGPGFEKPG